MMKSLEGFEPSTIINVWNKVKEIYNKAVDFLKEAGLYEPIVKYIKIEGRKYVMDFCTSKNIKEETCSSIIDFVLKYLK